MSNADWLPAILELGDNKTLLPNLISQFQKVGVVPFVGAGLSAPYNLPQWSELIQSLATDEKTRTRVKDLLARTNMIVPLIHQLLVIAPEAVGIIP
jgi:hypothetical protein